MSNGATIRGLRLGAAAVIAIALAVQASADLAHGTFTWGQLPGYFTPLANIAGIVALMAAAVVGAREPRWVTLLRVNAATYLVIVALVYWALLAPHATALHPWANVVLHGGAAVMLTVDWLVLRAPASLPWATVWSVLTLPAAWLSYLAVRAQLDGWLPYPFLDTSRGWVLPVTSVAAMVGVGLLVAGLLRLASHLVMGGKRGRVRA